MKKAEQSGAAKHPETSDRMSKLVEQVRVYKTKLVGFKDEKLAEEFSGTGEPAGEAGEIINEANAITALATRLAKQTEGDQKDRQEQTDSGTDGLYLLSWLIWGLVGLLAIAALMGFALFLVKLNRRVGDLETMHGKVVQRFVVLEKALGEQRAHALTVVSGVTRLRDDMAREIGELQRSYRDMRTGQRPPTAVAPDPFAYLDRGPVRDPGPTFPALVSDYLSKVSESKKVEVEADFRTNLFVPAPGGPFVLVQDDDGTGSGIVLPKSRLQKGQEFVSYYKGTYYCDSPSAGEVFIVEPAVVDHTGGGWRLRSPGRLELK